MAELSKTLIVGANGSIGTELDFGIKISRAELDVLDVSSIIAALDKYKPVAVLNLASLNLRDCQNNPILANKINVLGVYNLAVETEKRGIALIQMSSGAVFNGLGRDSFSENSLPSPQNIYGQTKYIGEIVAGAINKRSLVIRTGWLFGFKVKENFFNRMLESVKSGLDLKATCDQEGSFTYVKDFIDTLKKLIMENKTGIHHIANSDGANAYDFAELLVSTLKSKSKIIKTSVQENEKEGLIRSRSEVLISHKIKLRVWKSALKECLKDLEL